MYKFPKFTLMRELETSNVGEIEIMIDRTNTLRRKNNSKIFNHK